MNLPRTMPVNDGTDPSPNSHPPQLAKQMTERQAPNAGGGRVYAAWRLQLFSINKHWIYMNNKYTLQEIIATTDIN